MKYIVNGVERDLIGRTTFDVSKQADRLVVTTPTSKNSALIVKAGNKTHVSFRGKTYLVEKATRGQTHEQSSGEIRAPMPGQIVDVLCKPGEVVAKGDRLLVLEAMKMQQPILAITKAKITEIFVQLGDQIDEGQILITLEVIL